MARQRLFRNTARQKKHAANHEGKHQNWNNYARHSWFPKNICGPFAPEGGAVYSPRTMNHAASQADINILRPIALIGMMGVGKSTIGRRLAARLGIGFVDADHEIELAAGMSIPEIFEKYGESAFRDGEMRVIARLTVSPPKVIATGGGAFMNDATRALLLDKCTVVWIDANLNMLAERVARRDNRPLLKGKNVRQVLAELAAVRNPVYALAPIHIQSKPAPHDATVDAILARLS